MNQNNINGMRVEGFDALRGLCALGVVFYHMLNWFSLPYPFTLGLHGVYIFFALSGASLYIAYSEKINSGESLVAYLGARYFRLLPLYALILVSIPWVDSKPFDWGYVELLVLNVTFAFGFASPGQSSLVTGGWSLGIEFCFYLMFPCVVALLKMRRVAVAGLLVVLFFCQQIFVNKVLAVPGSLVANWVQYVQPLAFAFYFVAGCAIGRYFKITNWMPWAQRRPRFVLFSFLTMLVVIGSCSGRSTEETLTGLRGALLPLLCILLVFLSGMLQFKGNWKRVAEVLGNMSYGVYLLHPVVHTLVARYAGQLRSNPILYIIGIAVITAVIALAVEKYYERPIRNLGKKIFASAG